MCRHKRNRARKAACCKPTELRQLTLVALAALEADGVLVSAAGVCCWLPDCWPADRLLSCPSVRLSWMTRPSGAGAAPTTGAGSSTAGAGASATGGGEGGVGGGGRGGRGLGGLGGLGGGGRGLGGGGLGGLGGGGL
jgi:hypothetical protein